MPRESVKRKVGEAGSATPTSIVIDSEKGLVFENEDALYAHFAAEIRRLEERFFGQRSATDLKPEDFAQYENLLNLVLEDPDEIWEDRESLPDQTIYIYLGRFEIEDKDIFYAALAYVNDEAPSFVFLHFPTTDLELIERYRQGTRVYDRAIYEVRKGAIEGDALSEGDELAIGLYKSMLTVRGEKDINEDDFHEYTQWREISIEEADEIWRTTDFQGNTLVSFIKEVGDAGGSDLYYIVITVEDEPSGSHALLFSFPTRDRSLVDRYRHGENLHAEEIVQEASH